MREINAARVHKDNRVHGRRALTTSPTTTTTVGDDYMNPARLQLVPQSCQERAFSSLNAMLPYSSTLRATAVMDVVQS